MISKLLTNPPPPPLLIKKKKKKDKEASLGQLSWCTGWLGPWVSFGIKGKTKVFGGIFPWLVLVCVNCLPSTKFFAHTDLSGIFVLKDLCLVLVHLHCSFMCSLLLYAAILVDKERYVLHLYCIKECKSKGLICSGSIYQNEVISGEIFFLTH